MTGTVIDLGVPGETHTAPPRARVRWRGAAVPAVLAALLLGLAAPAPPAAAARVVQLTLPDDGWYEVGAGVIVTTAGGRLVGRSVADGAPRWTADRVSQEGLPWLTPDRAVLLDTSDDAAGAAVTVAHDVLTGARLWRHDGRPAAYGTGSVLLRHRLGGDRGDELTGVDARTGAIRLRVPAAPGDAATVADDGTLLAVVAAGGDVTLRSLADGTVTRRGRAEVQAAPGPVAGLRVEAVAGVLVVVDEAGDATTVTGYPVGTLRPAWRARFGAGDSAVRCADVVCVPGPGGLAVLDPRTGARLWHDRRWQWPYPTTTGPLVVEDADESSRQAGARTLVDPHTGRVLAELTPDTVLVRGHPDARVVRDPARPVRSAVRRSGAAAPFAVLDAAVLTDCHADGPHLVCPTVNGTLTVWRLPRAGLRA
ncbi:outer membrane protein assembly factor BamB family protein [Spirilliplanes yamanashiensis]|uniref:Uncharacterized protein n=1 Tax=Spirilliplanes yamanashiensis TaxID=42233 RepID=A0A8J3Y4I7_9ACTN|nr:PQQ-binding-like beta-propeller repeat protein [Spirilliplanes yamanashiensis]MDP9819928.1 hypothetical protein [Spirilliplanes yamanashiensis]GIJ01253.1 hypothetical protein Sya03_06050 [Spirilliplanes yamanashiensis]